MKWAKLSNQVEKLIKKCWISPAAVLMVTWSWEQNLAKEKINIKLWFNNTEIAKLYINSSRHWQLMRSSPAIHTGNK